MSADANSLSIESRPLESPTGPALYAKVYHNKSFQKNLRTIGFFLLFASFVLLMNGTVGQVSRSGHYHGPIPALVPWGIDALVLGLALLVVSFCLRNYYVVDFRGQCLRNQFKFFGLQWNAAVLPLQDIVAVTTQGKKVARRYVMWWTYRVVAVRNTGQLAAISDWRREENYECNDDARHLAQRLGCKHYLAPPCSHVLTSRAGASVSVTFGEPPVTVWKILCWVGVAFLLLASLLLRRKGL